MPSMFEETRKLAALFPRPAPVNQIELLECHQGLLRRDRPAATPEGSVVVDAGGGVWRRRGGRS